jgi:hypothetical protein
MKRPGAMKMALTWSLTGGRNIGKTGIFLVYSMISWMYHLVPRILDGLNFITRWKMLVDAESNTGKYEKIFEQPELPGCGGSNPRGEIRSIAQYYDHTFPGSSHWEYIEQNMNIRAALSSKHLPIGTGQRLALYKPRALYRAWMMAALSCDFRIARPKADWLEGDGMHLYCRSQYASSSSTIKHGKGSIRVAGPLHWHSGLRSCLT